MVKSVYPPCRGPTDDKAKQGVAFGPLNDRAQRTGLHRALAAACGFLDTKTKGGGEGKGEGQDSYIVASWKSRPGKRRRTEDGQGALPCRRSLHMIHLVVTCIVQAVPELESSYLPSYLCLVDGRSGEPGPCEVLPGVRASEGEPGAAGRAQQVMT
jgi:hypothetical protein